MTVLEAPASASASSSSTPSTPKSSGRSLSVVQRIVIAVAALPLIGIAATSLGGALGLIPVAEMLDINLGLGEDPGMFVFGAMLWCSPVQWLVRRTQVLVRKWLGILFSGYALSNFAMFVIEEGLAASLSAPFLVVGVIATVAAIPLLLTSGRWAQRKMGMRRWRNLHKLTYLIALALVLHVALIGELTLGAFVIIAALAARIPSVARSIERLGERLRRRTV